jgi:hypothetical protein
VFSEFDSLHIAEMSIDPNAADTEDIPCVFRQENPFPELSIEDRIAALAPPDGAKSAEDLLKEGRELGQKLLQEHNEPGLRRILNSPLAGRGSLITG